MAVLELWVGAAISAYARARLDRVEKKIAVQKKLLKRRLRNYGPLAQKSMKAYIRDRLVRELAGAQSVGAQRFHRDRISDMEAEIAQASVIWEATKKDDAKPYGALTRRRLQLRLLLQAAEKLGR